MEADYGTNSFVFDGPDEYDDPDYSNYEQWQYDDEENEEEEEVVEPPPPPTFNVPKTKHPKLQKQPNDWTVQRQNVTSKRKSKRKRINSVEEFYRTLLQWNLKNTSTSIGRTFGNPFPAYFTNKTQYFDALKDVVMEESRASITQSLAGPPEGKLELRLLNVDDEGDMMLLEFAIVSGGLDLTRPGWVFKLFPAAHGTVMPSATTGGSGGGGGGYRGAFGHNPHHHKHSSSDHMDLETLAVVAQGKIKPRSLPSSNSRP